MSIPIDRPRIFSYITRTKFLHLEDALSQDKLRFFVGDYERGAGANVTAYFFWDIKEARVILNDLAWSKAVDITDYRGGLDSNGLLESRVLKIQRKEDTVWIQVQNGPGEHLSGGAIKPAGKSYAEIPVALTIHESRKMAFAALDYLRAWEVVKWLRSELLVGTGIGLFRKTGIAR